MQKNWINLIIIKQNKVNEIIMQEVILLNPIYLSYIQTIFFFFEN